MQGQTAGGLARDSLSVVAQRLTHARAGVAADQAVRSDTHVMHARRTVHSVTLWHGRPALHMEPTRCQLHATRACACITMMRHT